MLHIVLSTEHWINVNGKWLSWESSITRFLIMSFPHSYSHSHDRFNFSPFLWDSHMRFSVPLPLHFQIRCCTSVRVSAILINGDWRNASNGTMPCHVVFEFDPLILFGLIFFICLLISNLRQSFDISYLFTEIRFTHLLRMLYIIRSFESFLSLVITTLI